MGAENDSTLIGQRETLPEIGGLMQLNPPTSNDANY